LLKLREFDLGLFDSVKVKCPKCGGITTFQSKAGYCHLLTYEQDHVPTNIAVALADKTEFCEKCHAPLVFKSSVPVYARVWAELGEQGED
jgi:RNase P subunit RPR2